MPANRTYTQAATMARRAVERTYRPRNWGSHWFGTALPRVRAGGVAKVHIYGDSITVGDDASSVFGQASAAANSTAQKDAWRHDGYPGVLRRKLQERYGNAGEGFQPFGLAVTTGTWTARSGPGMSEGRASAAASLTFKVFGTSIELYWRVAGLPAGTNQFRYQVDGGSFTTVTQSGPADPGRTVIGSLSDAEHTVRIEWVAGTCAINGVRGLRAGQRGILVERFALHGAPSSIHSSAPRSSRRMAVTTTSGSPNITAGTGGFFTSADIGSRILGPNLGSFGAFIGTTPTATTATLVDQYGAPVNAPQSATAQCTIDGVVAGTSALVGVLNVPQGIVGNAFAPGVGNDADLVILALGANDAASGWPVSPESYQDGLGRIAMSYLPIEQSPGREWSGDFVIVHQHVGRWFDTEAKYSQIVSWGREVAAGLNAAVLDMWEAGHRSYSYAQTQRYWSGINGDNSVHLSKNGHEIVGEALLALVRQ